MERTTTASEQDPDFVVLASAADARAVGRLFWGLLLVALDFALNGIDVLPDALGLLLLVVGAKRLSPHSFALRAATMLYAASFCLEVVGWFGLPAEFELLRSVLGPVQTLLLTYGLAEFAGKVGRDDLATSFRNITIGNFVLELSVLLFGGYAQRGGSLDSHSAAPIVVGLVLAGLVVLMFCLVRLRQLRAWLLAGGTAER